MPKGRGLPAVAGAKPPLSTTCTRLAVTGMRDRAVARQRRVGARARPRPARHGIARNAAHTAWRRARPPRLLARRRSRGSVARRVGGKALQEHGHGAQVAAAQVLRAVQHHLGHRAQHRGRAAPSGSQQPLDVGQRPNRPRRPPRARPATAHTSSASGSARRQVHHVAARAQAHCAGCGRRCNGPGPAPGRRRGSTRPTARGLARCWAGLK